VVNLQIFMVYGPATPDGNKLVPYVIRNLLEGRAPELSSGDRQVDWVHVGDVAEGIVRCALVGEAPRSPVPLGTGHLHTVRQVVESLVELIGIDVEPRFGSLTDRRQEVVRAADTALTRELLAWAPGIGLGEGLSATVAWHRGESDGRPDGLAAVEGAAR
jgi:nucleoside-diphosphate-sugar epimerase